MSYSIVFSQRTARWEVVSFDPYAVEPGVAAPEGDGQFDELNPYHTRVSWFVAPDGTIHMSERGQGHGDMPEFQQLMNSNFAKLQGGGTPHTPLAVGEFSNGGLTTMGSLYPQHEVEPHVINLYNERRAADPNLPQYNGQHDFKYNMDPKAVMPPDPNPFPKMRLIGHQELLDPADVDAVMQAAQVKPEITDPTGQSWVWDPTSHKYERSIPTHDTDRSHAWGGDADLFDPATQTEKAMNPLDEGNMHMGADTWELGPGIYDQMDVPSEERRTWSATCPSCGQRESIFPSWHGPISNGGMPCRHCGHIISLKEMRPEVEPGEVGDPDQMLGDTPQQMDNMLKHAEVPSQYPAWGEPHCDNCEEGLPQWRESKPGEPRLCEKCQDNPAVLEDLRRQFRRTPPQQEHRVGPFPERTPKPNPYKQDNTFPSMPTTKSSTADDVISRSHTMKPDFRHYAEEQAWREANGIAAGDASLDACPECHDPGIVDVDGTMICSNCGHRQRMHDMSLHEMNQHINAPGGFAEQLGEAIFNPKPYQGAVRKTALCPPLLALAAPLVEGAAGALGADTAGAAIGGAVRAGAGALTDTGLKGFVARHAALKGAEGMAGQAEDAVQSMNPAGTAAPATDDAAMYSHFLASDDDDDKGGGIGSGDEGHDDDPDAGNQAFEQEHGDSPDLLKNTDMLGPGQEGGLSEEQHEALAHLEGCGPLVAAFIMAPESGRDSPIIADIEKMLRGAFKGHQGFESKFAEHSGEGHPDNSEAEGNFEESLEALKDDPNGDADSSDHPADPNEAAEVEERHEDNGHDDKESSVHEAQRPDFFYAPDRQMHEQMVAPAEGTPQPGTTTVMCPRCQTPMQTNAPCPRCGASLDAFGQERAVAAAMLPGQAPPASNMNQQMQGQPMPAAPDANSTACPMCGGTAGQHMPGCTAHPVAPQPQQPGMGVTASTHEAAPHPDGCECSFPVCVRKRGEGDGEDEGSEDDGMEHESGWYQAGEHDHAENTNHGGDMFENTPDEQGAPAHDLTVNSNMWVDETGQPLQKGATYLLKSPNWSIPDRITVEEIHGDKVTVLVHTKYLSYENTLTAKTLANSHMSFQAEGDAGVGLDPSLEHNNDDHTDAESAGMDSSDTYTPVSHVTDEMKSLYPDRGWLWAEPDPMDKTAGKDYTPREQRHFIEETGKARNLDRLELEGTHYVEQTDFDSHFNWGI